MANFEFDENAIPNLIHALEQADLYDTEAVEEMLFAGAQILTDEAKSQMARAGHVDTGDAIKHIGFTRKVKKGKTGAYSVTVTVKGKGKNGVPNAVKTFVANYGRQERYGQIVGSHFWNRARQKAEPEMVRKCEEIATNKLKQKGLI